MYLTITIEDFETKSFRGRHSLNTPYSSITDNDVENYKKENKEKLIMLEKFLLDKNNTLDAESIQNHLFPITENDIFLSHAHGDENDVIKLAITLRNKGLKVFIDSCVWGNAYNLLKIIDKKYCRDEGEKNFNYDQRNFSTANVYMILNTALHKVIEKSELLIFLATSNSTRELTVNESIKEKKGLSSPWIYSELTFAQQVKRIDRRPELEKNRFSKILAEDRQPSMEHAGVKIHYPFPKTDYKIENNDFNIWLEQKKLSFESFEELSTYAKGEQQLEVFYKHLHKLGEKLLKEKKD